jgi:FkbM family methyltransferase
MGKKKGFFRIISALYSSTNERARALISRAPLAVRLFRILSGRLLADESGIAKCEIDGHIMYLPPDDIGVFLLGGYEPGTTSKFNEILRSGDVVVDIGAHIGYYTLLAARIVGPQGRVFAFEPEPSNYGLLLRNIEANKYQNVTAIRKAVSDRDGHSTLFIAGPSTHSLVPKPDALSTDRTIEIETVTLDSHFSQDDVKELESRISLVKIDVEGAEMMVISGMRRVMKSPRFAMICEYNPTFLTRAGMDPSHFLSSLYDDGFQVSILEDGTNGELPDSMQEITPGSGVNLFCRRKA